MSSHWSENKEVVKTNFFIYVTLRLIQILPMFVVNFIALFVAFFFYAGCGKVRAEIFRFQENAIGKRKSVYRTILSFSLCLVERMSGWLGKIKEKSILFNDDDVKEYLENLRNGKGAFIIGSHLGNMDLLRSLSTFARLGIENEIPVTVIMEINSSEKFNAALKKINPKYSLTALDPASINPETIFLLQEKIEHGEIVVITGDRTSVRAQNRVVEKDFFGKKAKFPYGVFLLASLLESPTYFLFGLRTKSFSFFPKYSVHLHKSEIDFCNCSRKVRNERMEMLLEKYISLLEFYSKKFPYQWYNFFNFWD